ncbi:MAG: serine/threonine-protein kinase [bacterium]
MSDRTSRDDKIPNRSTHRDPTPGQHLTRRDAPAKAHNPTSLDGTALQPEKASPSLMTLPRALADYRILKGLPAKGNEADLFMVERRTDGEQFVAKVYREGKTIKPEVIDIVSKANPEHVIQVIDHGTSDGHDYELQEYAPLGSLTDLIQREGPCLDEGLAKDILHELLIAMRHIHEKDIVHRDLKPGNILVRKRSPLDLVLTDFGISSVMDNQSAHETSGDRTYAYSAPEASTGMVFKASDYWSLGIIMVEIVSGAHPYAGLSNQIINTSKATKPVELVDVEGEWLKLCHWLLKRDPDKRWGAEKVQRWLDGDKTLPEPVMERAQPAAVTAHRPCVFQGREYQTAESLAAAFAIDWDEGIKYLMRNHLHKWLAEELGNQQLTVLVEDLDLDTSISGHTKLFRVIRKMNPALPPTFRSLALTADNLITLARQAMTEDVRSQEILIDLMNDDVLAELKDHPASGPLVRANRDWRKAERTYQDLQAETQAKGPGQRPDRYQSQGVRLGMLLLGVLDPKAVALFRKRTKKQVSDLAREVPWYADLGQPGSADTPALLLMQELQETAEEIGESNREIERRKREAARAERKARAKVRLAKTGRALAHVVFFTTPIIAGIVLLQRYELSDLRVPFLLSQPQWVSTALLILVPQVLMLVGYIAAEFMSLALGGGAGGAKRFWRTFGYCLFSPITMAFYLAIILLGANFLAGLVGNYYPSTREFTENPIYRDRIMYGLVGLAYLILWLKVNRRRVAN